MDGTAPESNLNGVLRDEQMRRDKDERCEQTTELSHEERVRFSFEQRELY